jgi:hypothetical protein
MRAAKRGRSGTLPGPELSGVMDDRGRTSGIAVALRDPRRSTPPSRTSVVNMLHTSLPRFRFIASVALLAVAPAHLRAQTPPQKEVEILGVEPSALDRFKETVQKQCNGKYCMATLTGTLGYAAASVMLLQDGMVVAVIDAAHKDRIRHRATPSGAGPLPESWRAAVELASKEPMAFQAAVVGFAKLQKDGVDAAVAECPFGAEEGAKARPLWAFMGEQMDSGSRDLAAWTLANHAQPEARMVAAAVLMKHPDHDLTWWSLAEGLRDSNERVQGTSQQALQYLTRERARRVDWSPAVPALRAVLDGTHLGAVPGLARMLVATKVAPELAGALLAGAGQGLLLYSPCTRAALGDPVRSLLSRLSGKDHGQDIASWKTWVASLKQSG